MKLIFAIIHNDDYQRLIDELNSKGIGVTRLSSSGGFLRSGNITLLIGVNNDMVDDVIEIIKKNSKSRKQFINASVPPSGIGGVFSLYPVEVVVGGATIFVVNIEDFHKG